MVKNTTGIRLRNGFAIDTALHRGLSHGSKREGKMCNFIKELF